MELSDSRSSVAPALERGLVAFSAITQQPGLNLEELSKSLHCPKSSLSRILDTLVAQGLVERGKDKRYRALYRLVPNQSSSNWDDRLQAAMEDLCLSLGLTVEFYEKRTEGMVITRRREDDRGPIQVRARLGFVRRLTGEIDAVAGVAINALQTPLPNESWRYGSQGERCSLDSTPLRGHLEAMGRLHGDQAYNSNGIRRMAGALMDSSSQLKGVLALAEPFTPQANAQQTERLRALERSIENLQLFLRDHHE